MRVIIKISQKWCRPFSSGLLPFATAVPVLYTGWNVTLKLSFDNLIDDVEHFSSQVHSCFDGKEPVENAAFKIFKIYFNIIIQLNIFMNILDIFMTNRFPFLHIDRLKLNPCPFYTVSIILSCVRTYLYYDRSHWEIDHCLYNCTSKYQKTVIFCFISLAFKLHK